MKLFILKNSKELKNSTGEKMFEIGVLKKYK